ncbi:hypothetical protein QBC47DRAFT_344326 [Echria macrotheca]|uniref:DEAD/DEAH box helicase n=1 Tax=Echria macrotheca TaxID=438768 RepID=A0AAJ0BEH2_9PEZI|nr:hypothetical protein QBC47DRAFT_344326 [Echria macrotheca]
MAEEPHNTSDISEHVETTPAKEDAETTAARRELKQTSISEKAEQDKAGPLSPDADRSESDEDAAPKDKPVANPARTATPDTDPGDVKSGDDSLLREQVSSPKKKRAHDELVADGSSTAGEGSGKRAHDTADAQSRTEESEPEKKRPRDRDSAKRRRSQDDAVRDSGGSSRSSIDRTRDTKDTSTKTSTSAFASSAFAKLASSSTSPFGALGSAGKPSLFGGSGASGSFSVLGGSKPAAPAATAPKLSFASGTASAPSPFAINGGSGKSVFGSSFASPFGGSAFGGGSLSGPRLSSFAKPGDAVKSEKPARPFGAPESDAEEGSEKGEDGGEDAASDKEDKGADKEKEESKAAEEKKRLRLQKVVVDDGESGEVTLLAVRAKMYVMEKSVGWKERGAGMLKVNVPKSTIEFDEYGNPDPTTFDASVLDEETNEDGSARSVRLIMRQDHTLRVILNTAVLPGMKFQLNQKLKAAFVLFTTFDGEAKQVQMKVRPDSGLDTPGYVYRNLIRACVNFQHPDNSVPSEQIKKAREKGTVKRKRATTATTPEDGSQSPDGDGNKLVSSVAGARKRKNPIPKDAPVECLIEWPAWFRSLETTHRALNLVYTFCCTRKHVVTTLETMRSTVEANTKQPLVVEDVAAVVALRPEGMRFAYVDETMLLLDARGAERGGGSGSGGRGQTFAPDASVGGVTGLEGLGPHDRPKKGREVLYFEFVDEDLKRQVADRKTGDPVNPSRRLRDETLKMPVFSQKQMMGLIEKRNGKFAQAVVRFLNRCVEDKVDPEMTLRSEAEVFVPRRSMAVDTPAHQAVADTLPESIPTERKSIPEIVQELKESPWYTGQIVPDGHRVFEPQEAVFGELDFLLSQDLVNALYNAKGITRFYAHQADAINGLHAGRNVVVATSTSSGKSLIYQLPVLHALERDRNVRAMYIFPTKALAQDQKRSLREMMALMPGMGDLLVETFDGDTPMTERNMIRDEARIIFTNPDMLHITILPQEERWRTFLQNLKYVVVDELHYYNGLLGSHVAFIMRRLRRTCAALGNRHVKFISCSATVANPEQHFRTIFGIDRVTLVDFDGSPSGRKEFLCWNTPYKDPGDPSSGRGDAKMECARLFCQLILRGVRVIAFCRVREQCEKLVAAVRQELENLGRAECINRVMGYRGGYTAQDRRRIETEMFEGKLVGIIATTALELGVDIGSLDCVLTWGFPYTIANLRQQSGRAGRRNKDSLSILVGDAFATDQYYMQNPDELFTKPNCELQVDLDNMLVREGHIQCAAYEMPIRPAEDAQYFGEDLAQVCEERLIKDEMGFYHCHDRFRPLPSRFVSIRDTEEEHFAIVDITNDRNVVLEELDASRATFTIYDGAIFLHQGQTYLVRDFNPDKRMARVEKVKVDWTTQQRDYTDIDPVETEAIKRIGGSKCCAYHGAIRIKQVVFGYFKVDKRNRVLDAVQVDNPPVVRYSKGMWLDVPKEALDILVARRLHVAGAIHAAQHAVMSLMPNFVVSMPGDVRTECKNSLKEFAKRETQRKRPARLTFYDAKGGAGGSGINTKAFEFVDVLLRQAVDRVAACQCPRGCVECVASELCHEANEVMSKAGSEVVLRSLLGMEIDVESLPMGPEEGSPAGVETVVLAEPVRPRGRLVGGESGI